MCAGMHVCIICSGGQAKIEERRGIREEKAVRNEGQCDERRGQEVDVIDGARGGGTPVSLHLSLPLCGVVLWTTSPMENKKELTVEAGQ